MRCERLALSGDPAPLVAQLRALIPGPEAATAAVAEIINAVRSRGDAAVLEYTRALDTGGEDPSPLLAGDDELDAALRTMDPEVRRALELAIENVEAVAALRVRDRDAELRRSTH